MKTNRVCPLYSEEREKNKTNKKKQDNESAVMSGEEEEYDEESELMEGGENDIDDGATTSQLKKRTASAQSTLFPCKQTSLQMKVKILFFCICETNQTCSLLDLM
jgi:hypothetical protein